jgi:predicted SnoaL-like aldol condensation-catalyzing enzyme
MKINKESDMSRKEDAQEFLRLASKGNSRGAFSRFVGDGFRHHNPWFKGDADSLMLAMEEAGKERPDKTRQILRALEDGDFVAVHSWVKQTPDDVGGAVVHIFRFAGDKIVELWDVGQGQPEEMVNEYGMF